MSSFATNGVSNIHAGGIYINAGDGYEIYYNNLKCIIKKAINNTKNSYIVLTTNQIHYE